jgi:hypothetical protein
MNTRVAAGGTLIRRYVLALPPTGAGIEAAVSAASVPPLSGGPGSHCSEAAAHALTVADSVAEPAVNPLMARGRTALYDRLRCAELHRWLALTFLLLVRSRDHRPGLVVTSIRMSGASVLRMTWTMAGVGDVDDRNDNPDQHDEDHLGGADRGGG